MYYKSVIFIITLCRKTNQSESADDEVVRENEETAVSDSSAVKDAESKVCEPSIQGDQEQVDSSTNEPLLSDIKEEGKEKTEDTEGEKKEENSEAATATPENTSGGKKKSAARKRSSTGKSSGGKSSRSSK